MTVSGTPPCSDIVNREREESLLGLVVVIFCFLDMAYFTLKSTLAMDRAITFS